MSPLCLSSSLLMTCSSRPNKRTCTPLHRACHNTHTVNTSGYICVCVCVSVCQGDSHIPVLSRCKVPLRGDKSPLPCQIVLALHPQFHISHTNKTTKYLLGSLKHLSLYSFLIFLTPFFPHCLIHPFS